MPNSFIEPQENQRLFNQLPLPSTKKKAIIEEDDEFLHKKEPVADIKPKSKITIPLLSDVCIFIQSLIIKYLYLSIHKINNYFNSSLKMWNKQYLIQRLKH